MNIWTSKFFKSHIDLTNKNLISINVENISVFRNIVLDFYNGNIDETNYIEINDKQVVPSKNSCIIFHPFYLDINSKKMLSETYKMINDDISHDEELFKEFNDLSTKITNFIEDSKILSNSEMEYNEEIFPSNIFNMVSFSYSSSDNYLEYFTSSLKLYYFVLKIKIFFFINIQDYFDYEELSKIKKELCNNETILINISSKHFTGVVFDEVLTIDKDLCEF